MTKAPEHPEEVQHAGKAAVREPEVQPQQPVMAHAVLRTAAPSMPPPDGSPPAVRAAQAISANSPGAGARARMMHGLQSAVGNARAGHMVVQARMSVSQPGDPHEREAERVATHVMRMAEPPHPDTASAGALEIEGRCPHCEQAQRMCAECEKQMQRKTAHGGDASAGGEVEAGIRSGQGGGQPLAPSAREFLEPRMGRDFSGVRVHSDAGAARLARAVSAEAFTTGNDIFFAEGRYQPDTSAGRGLLAHELTHTVQQGQGRPIVSRQAAPKRERPRRADRPSGAMDTAAPRPVSAPPVSTPGTSTGPGLHVQRAWYNFSIPFTDYEFDPSWEGVKTAAGLVKGAAESVLDWIVEQITNLVDYGVDWLKEKWKELEEFASSALDAAKDALANIVAFVKSPLTFLADAIMNFDAAGLEKAWASFSGLLDKLANGFKAMVDGVLGTVGKLWGAIDRFATWILDRIQGLIDNIVFRQLPDSMQAVAFKAINWLKSRWKEINDGWQALFGKVKSWIDKAIDAVVGFVQKVLSFGINVVIAGIVEFGKVVLFLKDLFSNPQKYVDILAGKSVAAFSGVEGLFAGLVGKYFGGSTSAAPAPAAQTAIHRSPGPGVAAEPKTSASWSDIGHGVAEMMGKKWQDFKSNPLAVVKQLLIDMIFPIIGDIQDIVQLYRDIKKIVTGPLSAGSLEELWTSILQLLGIPILIYHTVVSILMRTLMVPLIVASFVPHPLVKAIAAAVGYGLLGAFVQAEVLNLGQKLLLLKTGVTIKSQKQDAYNSIADSLIALAMAAAIMLLMLILHFLANVAKGIFNFVKGKVIEIEPAPAEAKGAPSGEGKAKTPESSSEPSKTIGGNRVIGETKTADGHHELKLTEDGRCIHCSPGCADLETKYPEELKQTKLQDELAKLKTKEVKDPDSVLKDLEELESKLAKQRAENLKASKSAANGSIRKIDEVLKSKETSSKLSGKDLGEFKDALRKLNDRWQNASESAEKIAGDPELEGVAKQEFDQIDADAGKLQSDINGKLNPAGLDLKAFYEEIRKLPPGERVAKILETAEKVAEERGFAVDRRVSTLNDRTVYVDPASGDFYSVDTQHGTFEHCGPDGSHIEEVNFSFEKTAGRDPTGNHDVRIR